MSANAVDLVGHIAGARCADRFAQLVARRAAIRMLMYVSLGFCGIKALPYAVSILGWRILESPPPLTAADLANPWMSTLAAVTAVAMVTGGFRFITGDPLTDSMECRGARSDREKGI